MSSLCRPSFQGHRTTTLSFCLFSLSSNLRVFVAVQIRLRSFVLDNLGFTGFRRPADGRSRLSSVTASPWSATLSITFPFSFIGTAVGGTASAFYGLNHAIPIARRLVAGPMWFQYLVGAPPVLVFSSACAGLAGGAVPALAQLVSSSYHAATTSSISSSSSNDEKMHKTRTTTL